MSYLDSWITVVFSQVAGQIHEVGSIAGHKMVGFDW